nr:MAG TPA: hypothetical protein [Caudoviricetes sp.]
MGLLQSLHPFCRKEDLRHVLQRGLCDLLFWP